MRSNRLDGRIALITGASRGIGAAIAKRFAAEGAHLILTARTVGGLEEVDDAIRSAGGSKATLVPADLLDMDKIDQIGAAIYKRFGKLDILVGNAGTLGILSPVGHVDPKVWDETFALNVTVNYRLIRAFDSLLRQSDSGRAIFVSSGAARSAKPYWGPYSASKAALESLVQTYAGEVSKTNIRVNLVNPGGVRTALRALAFPGEDPMRLVTPNDITDVFVQLASPDCTDHGATLKVQ
jgi:NAD(P)-dependent dehydrogenase (short-subunit alcohol dehydrogenase family)